MNVLVVHDYGPLGRLLMERLRETRLGVSSLLISQPDEVDLVALARWVPADTDLIVNALWQGDPEQAEREPELARQWSFSVPLALAEYARERDIALLQLSSSYIFDGRKQSAYITSNPGNPFNQLGNWQWECEQALRVLLPRHLILRTGWSLARFVTKVLEADAEHPLPLSSRCHGQPVPYRDLARVMSAIVMQVDCGAEAWGTYQYAAAEDISQYELGLAIVQALEGRHQGVHVVDEPPAWLKLEPQNATLGCIKIRNTFGIKQLPWRTGLKAELALLGADKAADTATTSGLQH